jgi:Sodium/hydrogen exchanger family
LQSSPFIPTFEWIIVLLLGATLLAALARRVGAPHPTFLALGGTLLAIVPASPNWTLDPHLALTLFVAPVLVDTAYDTSLRDLRMNWRPVAGLVIAAVGTTVLAVALAARWLVPDMSWPVAVALGAIVAPPDAAAATAVMRQVKLPHRLLKILEGESLLNDASALLVYRLAIMTVIAGPLGFGSFAPVLIRRMGLTDDDPVGRELRLGCTQAYQSLLDAIKDDDTLAAKLLRKEYGAVVELNSSQEPGTSSADDDVPGGPLRRRAVAVARQRAFELRLDEVVGDDAYRGWCRSTIGPS